MRREIAAVGGNEVVFACRTDDDGFVDSARSVVRGNRHAAFVPRVDEAVDVVIHNHPSGDLDPSDEDLRTASDLSNDGIAFWIVDNFVERLYVVVDTDVLEEEPPDPDELALMLEPGGALSRRRVDYEPRDSQIRMLREVCGALGDDAVAVIEAGTGVGKSFAYLIPAIWWAHRNQRRVVVATATINLQQQLVEQDIPVVVDLLGIDVPVVLAKGRGNYLCRHRLNEFVEEEGLFADDRLGEIVEWANQTEEGSRSELPFVPDPLLWSRINADADACGPLRCRTDPGCFFMRARRRAAAALVVVTNHHLLFADMAVRADGRGFSGAGVLPSYDRLIIDEAHNIERSATAFFSRTLARSEIRKHFFRLYRERNRTGLLPSLLGRDAQELQEVPRITAEVFSAIDDVERSAAVLLGGETQLRVRSATVADTDAGTAAAIRRLQVSLSRAADVVADAVRRVEEVDIPEKQELEIVAGRLERSVGLCDAFLHPENDPERVFWIEKVGGHTPETRFVAGPVDVSSFLRDGLYKRVRTLVMTSATLTVRGAFHPWYGRVGLRHEDGYRLTDLRLDSPFDYRSRVLLAVPSDAPDPGDPGYEAFLINLIPRLVAVSEGRALVLFTSYAMLDRVYTAVRESLAEAGFPPLRQGDADRARLLREFVSRYETVLFATESFWEGIDAPGETLRLVVICRLPFRVFTDPITEARTEMIRARGGNPFFELALPTAVMRLRQGFGRLMRRRDDRGVVVITDGRVVRRRYGTVFIESLPETKRYVGEADRLIREAESHLYG